MLRNREDFEGENDESGSRDEEGAAKSMKKSLIYCVSIEPMYSQGVGNYVYICDSPEKVDKFRNVLKAYGAKIKVEEYVPEEDEEEETGWEFFERVYIIPDLSEPMGVCVFTRDYQNFEWIDEDLEEIDYEAADGEEEEVEDEMLPLMDCVNNNVEGELNISLEDFIKKLDIVKYLDRVEGNIATQP